MRRGSGLATLFFIVCAAMACANDQATINRVQPNALSKAMFTGEWYTKGTVIDTQIDAPIFVGAELPFDRIAWEIQEKFLIAKRSYEYVRGAEGEGVTSGEKHSVVAVYAISSHFDIRREYNPATGEQSNVVSENSVDRPWNERAYMRVDWSRNLLEDGALDGIPIKDVTLFDQDTGDAERAEFAPRFSQDNDGNVVYFDVVNRYWAEPVELYSGVPACYGYANSQMDCQPGAIAVRHSFARVEDRDYEPRPYTQDRMERFGYFLVKRDNYDDSYGATVQGREVYAMRHNLWLESHLKVDGKIRACTRNGECAGASSECDLAWGRARGEETGACTIPRHLRKLRPIRYYLTTNFPPALFNTALKVGADWDQAFTATVTSAMRIDCEVEGGGADCATIPGQVAAMGPVFAICRNPVTAEDAPGCGEPGFSPRFGDVRYNFVSWISDAHALQAGAPLGYGPASADPLTGEIVSGVANLFGDGIDQLAAQGRDILAMMQGDLSETATQSSFAFAAWLEQVEREAVAQTSAREADRHVVQLDAHDMAEANDDMDFSWSLHRLPTFAAPLTLSQIREEAPAHWKRIGAMHGSLKLASQGASNLSALRGSPLEAMLLDDDEFASALDLPPGTPLSAEEAKRVSPLGESGAFGARAAHRAQQEAARKHGNERACLLTAGDFSDDGLIGLLKEIDRAVHTGDGTLTWYGVKYEVGTRGAIDYEQVKEMLKQPILYGLMAHELGHTLGLRHNFSGSYDALNYRPGYWELRDDGTIGSRAEDPMSEAEIDGRIREYQYASVMDYGHNFVVSDAQGLGHYDVAAIKMGYADLAEVFTDAPPQNVRGIAGLDAQASPFMVFQVDPPRSGEDDELRAFHYSSWPTLLGGVANIQKRKDVRYRDLGFVASPLVGGGGRGLYQEGERILPVVPYLYCGDEFADSRPPCNRYDAGADPYEVMQSIIDNYWNYYPFSHFMRGRIGWDAQGVLKRSFGRYYAPLTSMAQIYALYRQFYEPILGTAFFEDKKGFGHYTLGVRAAYDLFRRVIATPEPGRLRYQERFDGLKFLSEDGVEVPLIPKAIDAYNGRYLRSYYEIGPSSEWIFFTSSGWFKEKALAMEALTWADTGYLGVDTSPDVREYSSSFYTIFPDSMSSFLGSIFASDIKSYAPRLKGGALHYPAPQDIVNERMPIDDEGAELVSPNLGFTLQLQAMFYGTRLIPNTFDQDFVNRSRVFAQGSSEAVQLALPVSYQDERSGLVYVAGSYPALRDGVEVETGTAARMISYANALKDGIAAATTAGDEAEAARLRAELVDFVDNLDVLRYLTHTLGHGSSGRFLGN